MTDEEFDRLLASPSARISGLSEADRHRLVPPHATVLTDDDDDKYPQFPPTVPITADMISNLPPKHSVELWHNTGMWNEGFENAREAVSTVSVSTDADRDDLVQWVVANFAEAWRNGVAVRSVDQLFETHVHAAYPEAPCLTLDGAKQVFQTVVDAWKGI